MYLYEKIRLEQTYLVYKQKNRVKFDMDLFFSFEYKRASTKLKNFSFAACLILIEAV
jgi:hypothetical protein